MKEKIRIIPLGGACEIGANSYYIDWKGKYSILLDCGSMGDSYEFENMPDFEKADSKFDLIIISHAHNDHIGALPYAYKYFLKENGKVIMHKDNSEIIYDILTDSSKIYENKNKKNTEKGKDKTYSSDTISLYKPEEIKQLIEKINFIDYESSFSFNDLDIVLYNAGHVLGSSAIYLKDEKNSIFYTGDFNDEKTFIHEPLKIPKNLKVDILICEGTNGFKEGRNISIDEKANDIAKYVDYTQKRKSALLIPSFALGRAQEVILCLEKAKEKGLIDKDYSYYISSGLMSKITARYKSLPEYKTLKSKATERDIPYDGAVISTSGFFTHGLIKIFADFKKNDPDTVILFPSLYASKKNEVKNFKNHSKCQIAEIDFSAHSSYQGILNLINDINPKITILVHGEKNSLENIRRRVKGQTIIPQFNGEEIIIRLDDFNYFLSSEMNNFLFTVGMSALGANNKNIDISKEPKKKCAELNTFLSINDKTELSFEKSIINLLATKASTPSAQEIANYLESQNYVCSIHTSDINVADLATQVNEGNTSDMSDIISHMARIISRYKKTSLIISGGYKFEIAISYLMANLFGCKAYYKNENMDFKDPSLPIQQIPINIDLSAYILYEQKINKILFSEYEEAKQEYEKLPENIKSFLYLNNNRFFLTNMGVILYNARKNQKSKNLISGENNTEWINPDIFDFNKNFQIKNKNFEIFINSNIYIRKLIFSEIKPKKLNENEIKEKEILLRFNSISDSIITYCVETENYTQEMKLIINPNFKNYLLSQTGKEIKF